jgi:HEAT repeat protein
VIHELLAESPRVRLRAVRDLPETPALGPALRRVLFGDRHAEVRAAAARRLGQLAVPGAADWLVDALGDGAPLVREAILRGLARCGDAAARAPVRARISDDRIWWVRRTAIYALAVLAAADELPAFEAALADPFWRVRHAAVKVLAALGARDLEVRARIRDGAAPPGTVAFLRAAWGPVPLEAPQRATTRSELPAALLDPDPAVVTARLAAGPALASPVALVELLCDPHAPLRLLAAERVAASGELAAYEAALDWLEEPRIPHVVETVERMLDRLGDPAAAIAERALARGDRPGAARWAIAWVVATKYAPLASAALARARDNPRLREVALPLAGLEDLVAWADERLVDAVAAELHARRAPAAHAALLELATGAHPRARALQIDAAARAARWSDVERGLADPHPGPRAVAVAWCRRSGRPVPGALDDCDPAVREAALDRRSPIAGGKAPRGIDLVGAARLVDDPDPWVARAAVRALAGASDPQAAQAAERALDAADPWIRAAACELPIADDRILARVLGLVADRAEIVRSAALAALARVPEIDARIAALVDRRGIDRPELPDAARQIARAWVHGDVEPVIAAGSTRPERSPIAPAPVVVARRPLGRAGGGVAPLAISGAHELSRESLAMAAEAGVDLWFWEPSYRELTRFLRHRSQARVIAGSYHAEPLAIEADVDRARRLLRREVLDVFLLFWSRSPARIDAEAFAALDRLRRAGKIATLGFSTHDRALARSAIEAAAWDVVMTRHSAAHPGIEHELLPAARERGTAVLTFSALCYGRMTSGAGAPSDADCIRYSLSQPGVTACINAPRRRAEVASRIAVLADPTLPQARLAELRAHGIGVRAESQRFNTLLRQPTRDAAAAARELLASELPPREELAQRPLPRPAPRHAARTQLGRTRRRGL